MREYKFRIWVNNKMIGPFSLQEISSLAAAHMAHDPNVVIEQFTGLKDKNGKEIFEGDILRQPAINDWQKVNYVAHEVFFHDGDMADTHIGFQMNRTHYFGSICGGTHYVTMLPKWTAVMEIIGNIHEVNPAAKEQRINTMITDPNIKTEQEAGEANNLESASQDQAMEATGSEEVTEG